MRVDDPGTNEKNVGPLFAIILKEISAGRPVEVTGGILLHVTTMDDYERNRSRISGLFGEVIQWKSDRTALIATRKMPGWVARVIENHIWEAPEMERWKPVVPGHVEDSE